MSRYYVWVNRGTETRPVPLQSEGYQGPYTLDTAKQYARIAASKGRYGRIVSSNTDPTHLRVVSAYPAGGEPIPNHPQHAEDLVMYLSQDFDAADYVDVANEIFGDDVDVYDLGPDEEQELRDEVEARERRMGIDCETPAYRIFQNARVPPPGQWYVHFTSASFSHFAFGASIDTGLALTRVCGPREKHRAPADNTDIERPYFEVLWGFAFPADTPTADLVAGASKYGRTRRQTSFILFRSDEVVVAYHTGDDETQALFVIGSEYDVITGTLSDWTWTIDTDSGEEVSFESRSIAPVLEWANKAYPKVASTLQPNRLVQIDPENEKIAERILNDITDNIGRMLEEGEIEFDQTFGDLIAPGEELQVFARSRFEVVVRGPCVDRHGKYRAFFLGGSYAPRREHFTIEANPCRTAAEWVDPERYSERRSDFFDVFMHEKTHAEDRGVRVGMERLSSGETTHYISAPGAVLPTSEYVNLPAEVKAFGRNVYIDVARSIESFVTGRSHDPEIAERFRQHMLKSSGTRGAGNVVEAFLRSSKSWSEIRKAGLTPENQRRILRDVYQQLDADGWIAALEEYLQRPALKANRRAARNGGDVDYEGQGDYVLARWPDAKRLGFGSSGTVWDVGDRVVKYTTSTEEVEVYEYVLEEGIDGLIPQVFSITTVETDEDLDTEGRMEGFIIEREPVEPVLQAFQRRSANDRAALQRMLQALEQADATPSRNTVLRAAKAAAAVDGGEGFGSALRELWARGLVVHDLRSDNLGVTQDGRIVAYDPGWFESL